MLTINWSKEHLDEAEVSEEELSALIKEYTNYYDERQVNEDKQMESKLSELKRVSEARLSPLHDLFKKQGVDISEVNSKFQEFLRIRVKYESDIDKILDSISIVDETLKKEIISIFNIPENASLIDQRVPLFVWTDPRFYSRQSS